MRGGDVAGMALFIAEALKGDGYDVVYMADVFTSAPDPTGNDPFYYIYWQYRTEPFSQDWEPRTGHARTSSWREVAFGQTLNGVFRFNNLWNYIGYNWLFTAYSPFAHEDFWRPRRTYADPEFELPRGVLYARLDPRLQVAMLDRMAKRPSEAEWKYIEAAWLDVIPDRLKPTTFLVLCAKSPRYTSLMDSQSANRLRSIYDEGVNRASRVGLRGVQPCRDFDEDDYVDSTHLSVSGAKKLAGEMATLIQRLKSDQP